MLWTFRTFCIWIRLRVITVWVIHTAIWSSSCWRCCCCWRLACCCWWSGCCYWLTFGTTLSSRWHFPFKASFWFVATCTQWIRTLEIMEMLSQSIVYTYRCAKSTASLSRNSWIRSLSNILHSLCALQYRNAFEINLFLYAFV